MKFTALLATAAIVAIVATPAAATALVNASFETGDTTGWTVVGTGTVDVLTSAADASSVVNFAATEGQFFAQLTAGGPNDQGVEDYTTLSQAFSLASAGSVSFDAAFLAFDETSDGGGFNDNGYVRVFNATTSTVVFQMSIDGLAALDPNGIGDFGHTDWTHLTQSLAAGDYVLEAGVENVGDAGSYSPGFDSKLLLDNVAVSVPEPATWGLMILGFAGLGAALRARRSQVAPRA